MSPTRFLFQCFLKVCFFIFLPNVIAVPVPASENIYYKFVQSLVANDCEIPKAVSLPFKNLSDTKHFTFLFDPLVECRTTEALKTDSEAHLLCQETFEVLQNISCSKPIISLPAIESARNFSNVCEEFSSMKNVLPKKDKYLSGRLVDAIVCKLLCSDKFESLCETLLWSHDVQVEIKKVAKKLTVQDKKVVPKTVVEDVTNDMKNVPQEPILDNQTELNQNFVEVTITNDNIEQNSKENSNDDSEKNLVTARSVDSTVTLKVNARNESQKIALANDLSTVFQSRILLPKNVSLDKQDTPKVDEKDNPNAIKDNTVKNEVSSENKTSLQDPGQTENQPITNETDKTTVEKNPTLVAEKSKAATAGTTLDLGSNKSGNSACSEGTKVEPDNLPLRNKQEENEVNDGSFENQKPEETVKPSDQLIPQDEKENTVEKPKDITVVLEKVTIDTGLKSESTTLQAYPDQIAEEDPDERDSEQYYNDTENEDYPKSEYENTLNGLKARKPVVKSSVVSEVANPNDVQNNYDFLLSRNNMGRGQEYTPMISSFPEQEDSHFFFYFLSIVLILMAGYLLVHNKQKIIALIIEGRHERRRRSHGAGYKKLDTK